VPHTIDPREARRPQHTEDSINLMPQPKKVSILLSCYGADALIAGYVDAILANRRLDLVQMVVVNIASSHQDRAYVHAQIQRLAAAGLTQIDLEDNISLYEAWNLGIQAADTEFVCNLNLDDRVSLDYFDIGLARLESRRADVFSSNCVITSRVGQWDGGEARRADSIPAGEFGAEDCLAYGIDKLLYLDGALAVKKNSVPHCAPIWRRDLHEQHGFFDCRRFDFCADYEFWLRLAAAGCEFLLHKDYMTLFYSGPGTVSDRLIHPDNTRIVAKWEPAFNAQFEAAQALGKRHDLLHFAFNHEAAFSDRRYHAHLPHRVSVCLPAHTVNAFVEQAVASVLAQSYQNIEVVIVLDGVEDAQADKLPALADLRVKVVSSHARVERSNSRNMAIALASGEWAMMMDSDDLLDPDGLKNLLRASLRDRACVWYGDVLIIDDGGAPIGTINYKDEYELSYMKYSWPSHGNTLWPAALLKKSRYPATYTDADVPKEVLAGEDVEFMVSVFRDNPGLRLKNCKQITYRWRRHSSCSYSKRYWSIFAVVNRLVRLFGDEFDDELFCKSLAGRLFDCYVWFAIDAALNARPDAAFRQQYAEWLAEKVPQRVLRHLADMATPEAVERHAQSLLDANRSIVAGVEAGAVRALALGEFARLPPLWPAPRAETAPAKTGEKPPSPAAKVIAAPSEGLSHHRINRFRNLHKGQDCLLMCNGPSLRDIDFSRIDRSRFVLFGLNKIYLAQDFLGEMPKYLAAVNAKVVQQSEQAYRTVKSVKFLSNRYVSPLLQEDPMTFYINTAVVPKPIPRFSLDVAKYVNEGWTVTHAALQIIFHMGFQRVFIVGLDHRFSLGIKGQENTEGKIEGDDPDHFHPGYFGGGQKWDLPDLANSEISYRAALEAFTAAGRSIINCTPGTACDIFPVEPPEILYTPTGGPR